MEKWITPINSLLALLIITALAALSSDIISYRLARTLPVKSPSTRPDSASAAAASTDLLASSPILAKGLFGPATRGMLAPLVAPSPQKGQANQPVSQGDLILLGTALGSFRETFALIQKNSTREERVFRLGDRVFEAGQLVSVHKEFAEILSGGQRVKILTPTAPASTSLSQPVQGQSAGLATQTGSGSYVIDQRALNSALDNIGQAMTDARLLPSVKDGKVEGFRASEVRPGGIFATVGIKNGDVLLRVNDFPIDSPEKAIQSFASLKGQSRIRLDLVRDGQPSTFNYDIR